VQHHVDLLCRIFVKTNEVILSETKSWKVYDKACLYNVRAVDKSNTSAEDGEHEGSGDEEIEDEGEDKIFYDKAKSFFDNISCDATDKSRGYEQLVTKEFLYRLIMLTSAWEKLPFKFTLVF